MRKQEMKTMGYCILIPIVFVMILAVPVSAINWEIDTVANSGEDAVMALDSAGKPHIAYYESGVIKLAKYTGSAWDYSTINNLEDEYGAVVLPSDTIHSLEVDATDNIHLIYNINGIKYAKWNGSAWEKTDIEDPGTNGITGHLALDAEGHPYIFTIRYTSMTCICGISYWDGSTWQKYYPNVELGFPGSNIFDFGVDASGHPHFCYKRYNENADNWILTYRRLTGSGWEDIPMTGLTVPASIAVDGTGNPSILYTDSSGLVYAEWTGSAWEKSIVSPSGSGNGLVLDSAGNPSVVYTDSNVLKYTEQTGSLWETSIIGTGIAYSLKLDAAGNPRILYVDRIDGLLKYAVGNSTQIPYIHIVPVNDKNVGDKFSINATTNLNVDEDILVEVYSASFRPAQKPPSGEFSGATGTMKVLAGANNNNFFTFDIDTSTFKPDIYLINDTARGIPGLGRSFFYVIGGTAPVSTIPTTSPIPPAPITPQVELDPISIIAGIVCAIGLFHAFTKWR